ncbi:MAG TPA: glutamate-5-semialdehyde dehydrogenase [Candidatus Hydrogenedentes bacterium]|nr:glutamate-5-semialdehyde dehydrogenase [Candidatus Hydrogenedentota bacterium]HRT19715.1 glutamate-5-semialdehyde dehydrogenase [Candidatus Hydrogenedentota bacterium]HRT64489.1 glutamate-5-semialdehyde dehydrogenase [Candidatus Hydrogenedentota bacterium]
MKRMDMERIGQQARAAADVLRPMTSAVKDAALIGIAERMAASSNRLKAENAKDLEAGRAKGLSAAMLDRLELNDTRIAAMADGLRAVAALPDPVGEILHQTVRPNGLRIARIRQPIGVVGIIYESRPNVTADAAALCLKSGNACILRGGSESIHSNMAIAQVFVEGAVAAGVPEHAVQIVTTTDRAAVGEMLKMDRYIDMIVPRGGKGLIARIRDESRIPVVAHLDGICHTYVHRDADLAMAKAICLNAKLQRPGVCNAMETLLVHVDAAPRFLPEMAEALRAGGCELRGCARTQALIGCAPATDDDWITEYLDKILSIRVVDSLEDAIAHINTYGSHHSDAIVTDSYAAAERFLDAVDSATVYVNASTRFTDGYEFGMGAEIGISTNKLHCRGPMALEELTTVKYVIRGSGQIRE